MIPVRRNRTTDIVTYYKLTAYQVDTSVIFYALVPDKLNLHMFVTLKNVILSSTIGR